ncbi:MAG: site-specific integrase [Pseudolabrys sp.]
MPTAGESDHGIVLDVEQLRTLVQNFRGSALFAIVATAVGTGARRGEILALRVTDLDPANKTLRIERAIEETKKHGLRLRSPKTRRGTRTITIDDDLCALFVREIERLKRLAAGIPDGATVDLSLVTLPPDALLFPNPPTSVGEFSFVNLRRPRNVSKEFKRKAVGLGFPNLRFHDLRGSHITMLLDAGEKPHVVAARCGHDPALMLRAYAKRTQKADTNVAATIGSLMKGAIG